MLDMPQGALAGANRPFYFISVVKPLLGIRRVTLFIHTLAGSRAVLGGPFYLSVVKPLLGRFSLAFLGFLG
jgi:hypothetical protein